ncbi:MAG: histidine triad nucleotide-binding protein [Anaerolineales bacterium]|nr:MAG: histidine triad nucleotide-binding protein [Anaerolineales bacterium]
MQEDCIFCQITAGSASAEIVYQDDEMTAFWDRHPAALVHILIIPNKHISSLNEVEAEDADLLGRLMLKGREIAEQQGVREKGYRLLLNVGKGGGQTVFHLHVHLIAGPHLMAIHG